MHLIRIGIALGIMLAAPSFSRAQGTVQTAASSADEKIWSGVFTAAQSERGKANYMNACTNCHGLNLDGTDRAPALTGEKFMLSWQNGSVGRLFRKIRDSMPARYADTVPEALKIDIVAFLLEKNGFPAGPSELKLDLEELETIQIARKGPQQVPNFALVQVVGCLAQGPDNSWVLHKTTEPVAVREETPNPQSLHAAATAPLGNDTFILVSAAGFKPQPHAGHKMEARGLLYREPGENRINLTSLAMVSAACEE